jgi:hypothetical protein
MLVEVSLEVNGEQVKKEVPASRTLLEFLREDLGLTGTKEGCGKGECGKCLSRPAGWPREPPEERFRFECLVRRLLQEKSMLPGLKPLLHTMCDTSLQSLLLQRTPIKTLPFSYSRRMAHHDY